MTPYYTPFMQHSTSLKILKKEIKKMEEKEKEKINKV